MFAHHAECTVFNVDFENAPEAKAPGGTMDNYAALKWIHTKVSDYEIDPAKISIFGDSGGGLLGMALAYHLAKVGESNLVKTVFP